MQWKIVRYESCMVLREAKYGVWIFYWFRKVIFSFSLNRTHFFKYFKYKCIRCTILVLNHLIICLGDGNCVQVTWITLYTACCVSYIIFDSYFGPLSSHLVPNHTSGRFICNRHRAGYRLQTSEHNSNRWSHVSEKFREALWSCVDFIESNRFANKMRMCFNVLARRNFVHEFIVRFISRGAVLKFYFPKRIEWNSHEADIL